MKQKTYIPKEGEIEQKWHVVDAEGQVLGRLASRIAALLRGKHKPIFCRHLDVGDFVVVTNAEKVRVTGNKMKQKYYYRHSGYPGGLKSISLEKMMQTHATRAIEYAVKGMLPHNRLEAKMLKRLRVYAGDAHPYQSQIKAASVKTGEPDS